MSDPRTVTAQAIADTAATMRHVAATVAARWPHIARQMQADANRWDGVALRYAAPAPPPGEAG